MRGRICSLLFTTLLLLGAGCRGPSLGVEAEEPTLSGDQQVDSATLRRLADEARALARTDGCATSSQCAALPMGAKPCGGPWTYLPYCPITTDRAALVAKLDQVARFEEEFNRTYGRGSTCDFVSAPELRLEGGRCTADTRPIPY